MQLYSEIADLIFCVYSALRIHTMSAVECCASVIQVGSGKSLLSIHSGSSASLRDNWSNETDYRSLFSPAVVALYFAVYLTIVLLYICR